MDETELRNGPSGQPPLVAMLYEHRASAEEVMRKFAIRWKEVEQPLGDTIKDRKELRTKVMARMHGTTPDIRAYQQARCQYLAAETLLLIYEANARSPEMAKQKVMKLIYEANAVCQPQYSSGMVNQIDSQAPAEYKAYFDRAAQHLKKYDSAHVYFSAEHARTIVNDMSTGNATGITRRYMLRYFAASAAGMLGGGMLADRLNDRAQRPIKPADAKIIGVVGGYYAASRIQERMESTPVTHQEFSTIVKNLAQYYQLTLPAAQRKVLAELHGSYARFCDMAQRLQQQLGKAESMIADEVDRKSFVASSAMLRDAMDEFKTIYNVQFEDPVGQASELKLFAVGMGIELEALRAPLTNMRAAADMQNDLEPGLKQGIMELIADVENANRSFHEQLQEFTQVRSQRGK